ncbi:hypothetical protein OHB02_30055 [Streptomyces albidoflavus]|nr:hypothetical protein OHB02_00140 [Streptomyces albidoflavus]WSB24127.1 hypothetical protein OHB02_30055 [Streptomyces albidoflavus]
MSGRETVAGHDAVGAAGLARVPVAKQDAHGNRASAGELIAADAWSVGDGAGPGQAGDGFGVGLLPGDARQCGVLVGGHQAVLGRDGVLLGQRAEDVDYACSGRPVQVPAAGLGEPGGQHEDGNVVVAHHGSVRRALPRAQGGRESADDEGAAPVAGQAVRGRRELSDEGLESLGFGAAPGVYRLVRVADENQRQASVVQQLKERQVGGGAVLRLIDDDFREPGEQRGQQSGSGLAVAQVPQRDGGRKQPITVSTRMQVKLNDRAGTVRRTEMSR